MHFLILGLLLFGPATIYELNRQFSQNLSLIYAASYGSLQTALKKLLNEGHVIFEERVEDGRNKKVYAITEAGSQAFYDWMQGPITISKLETEMLSKVFFLGLIEDEEAKKTILKGYLAQAKIALSSLYETKKMVSSLSLNETHQAIANYQFKTLDYGILAHESALSWLEEMITDLETSN